LATEKGDGALSKQSEMEDIFLSYEYLFREKLEAMDHMARRMFSEMRTFGIPSEIYESYVQGQFKFLAKNVIEKGDETFGSHRVRSSKTKHP
jgi:hypothetical protein